MQQAGFVKPYFYIHFVQQTSYILEILYPEHEDALQLKSYFKLLAFLLCGGQVRYGNTQMTAASSLIPDLYTARPAKSINPIWV